MVFEDLNYEQLRGASTIYIVCYWERDNIFTTEDGDIIYNIFNLITPLDLFLFRQDHNEDIFMMRSSPNDLVEIVVIFDLSYFEEYPKPILLV